MASKIKPYIMNSEIIPLKLKTQNFLNNFLEKKLNGFILNYKEINYLISIHHYLPIESMSTLDNIPLLIKINSCWSEVLIMETKNIDISHLIINSKIQNKLPKPSELIYLKTNDQRYQLTVIDYEVIPFDNINSELLIPYIKTTLEGTLKDFSGLSGSPVFINDKLIGIFSKFIASESAAYIIPIYIVIKNLIKKDNINIYGLPTDINKINSYNIKDGLIYHPSLKVSIPVSTFLILEGDIGIEFLVRNITSNMIINKPIQLNISNENFISNKELEYKINGRLLILLKHFKIDKEIMKLLYDYICSTSDLEKIRSFSLINDKIILI